ncbi:unnamed protein product [Cuscuta epithymum]|uniref:WPP domain-associated protein n=1 Tax=Cuscuta epithymum TaxID=186058 RepID=A0AAV0G132_9ASTE|nr:unnamed protein product [Cuscuta epithymum]CAH9141474.1 unnamed protein product [Cuscuta epithymum]
MGSQDLRESGVVGNGVGATSFPSAESEQMADDATESMNLGDDILQDLDLYWDDINGRLLVSRMVNDSVIKGMVGAVEQEAAEKVRDKEMEMAKLKEHFDFHVTEINGVEFRGSHVLSSNNPESAQHIALLDGFTLDGKKMDSLTGLRNLVKEQFEKIKNDMYEVKDHNSLRRIGSGSELVGLGGILPEKESQSWVHVDKTINNLETTVDSIFGCVDDILQLSKVSFFEFKMEKDLQRKVENMVTQNLWRSFLEDFENQIWGQNTQMCAMQLEKLSEIRSLRADLVGILKLLSSTEGGNLTSLGSHDMDGFHNKISRDHGMSSKSHEGNDKVEHSRTDVPHSFEAAQLKHLSKEALVSYFSDMITKMKRDHESILQEKTEELFTLKAEFLRLRERGSNVSHRKDKELDVLRKKIPEILSKLDDILLANEKCPPIHCKDENVCNLKNRLESLLSENCRLRDSLAIKKNELKCLSSRVSDASEKMLKHSMDETKMQRLVDNLNLIVEDVGIESSIREEVYKCFMRDHMQLHLSKEIYDTMSREAGVEAESTCIVEMEDSDCESLIMQEMYAVIYGEAIVTLEKSIKELYGEYLKERETRISLQLQASQRENEFTLEADEKIKLKEELVALKKSLDEKDRMASDISTALAKERDQFDLVSLELNFLREQVTKQQSLASENDVKLDLVKGQLLQALIEIEAFRDEAKQKVDELNEANHQRRMALALSEEKQSNLLLLESREEELRKKMEVIKGIVCELSTMFAGFEFKVTERISENKFRLEHSQGKLKSLVKKANLLRKRDLICQQSLEKRSSDLQMAEAEVDLLGDEVDVLLGLLEKIYIALDHYSPILQHYPGVIQILKLIRRELGGEYTKAV